MFTRSKTPHHIQHLAPRVSVDLFKLQNVHHRLCETPTAVIRAKAGARDLLSFSASHHPHCLRLGFSHLNSQLTSGVMSPFLSLMNDQSEASIRAT